MLSALIMAFPSSAEFRSFDSRIVLAVVRVTHEDEARAKGLQGYLEKLIGNAFNWPKDKYVVMADNLELEPGTAGGDLWSRAMTNRDEGA
jgi:hypothetical protein